MTTTASSTTVTDRVFDAHGLEVAIAAILGVYGLLMVTFSLAGGFIRNRLHISEILVSLSFGIAAGPFGLGLVDIGNGDFALYEVILWAGRVTLALQLMASALEVGKRYWMQFWLDQVVLLVIVMPLMWISSSLIVYLVLGLPFLEALLVGAAVTPTDPVLAASIVRGAFAKKHIRRGIRDTISAESGANDGLAFPFFSLPLLLIRFGGQAGAVVGYWFYWVWLYQVVVAGVVGVSIGALAAMVLNASERNNIVDKNTYLVYTISLSFILLGVGILMDMNEILMVFAGGVGFVLLAHKEDINTQEQIQESIDMLTTTFFFLGFGIIIPWPDYADYGTGWLVLTALLVLPMRRMFFVLLVHRLKWVTEIESNYEAVFIGWFGPVGVAAIFYSALAREELGIKGPYVVASFIILVSILLHGFTAASLTRWLCNHNRNRVSSIASSVDALRVTVGTDTDHNSIVELENRASKPN